MGPAHCKERIQDSVRVASASIQRVFPTLVGPEQALVMEQEVTTLLRKRPSRWSLLLSGESGFYSPYFIVPKKDGGLRQSRSTIVEPLSQETQVQDAYYQASRGSNQVEDWFVTIDIKDAYFHISILPQHRKFLEVCFRGQSVPISGSSVRSSTLTPHLYEVCGCCSGSLRLRASAY